MSRKLLPILGFGLLATVLAAVALVAAPERRELILDIYVLVLGGIAVIRLVTLTRRRRMPGERSEFDDALLATHRPPVRIAERDKLAREVQLGMQTAFDLHYRLRPTLVEIARNRLAGRGVSFENERRAKSVLGDEAWELLRPGREPPRDRNAPGIGTDELGRVVSVLERITSAPAEMLPRFWLRAPSQSAHSDEPRLGSLGEEEGRLWRRVIADRSRRVLLGGALMVAEEFGERCDVILGEVERAVVGKRDALELVLLGLLADGHVLIEDYPGLAKTLIARSFAQVASMEFARIQFTPDLMPSDVTGASIFDQRTTEFEFRPGPIFTNLLLADEINRAPPKTQAALLEAMQERQVTSEGVTRPLDRPFLVLATQNPIEYEGTYPLPEAQLDRFLLRISVGYPDRDQEWQIVERRVERETDEVVLGPVVDREELLELQGALEGVHIAESVGYYIVDVVAATRTAAAIEVGSSPRGTLAILKLARGRALMDGRDFVTPDDVKAVAVPALAHRLTLRPELWVQRIPAEQVVRDILEQVPTPAAEDVPQTAP